MVNRVCVVGGPSVPIEGMLPAPNAWALVVRKAKTTQSMSSVEVEPHLGFDEAILGFLAEVHSRVSLTTGAQ